MKKSKIISIMTTCGCCGCTTTKKYFEDDIYLCDECYKLNDVGKIKKIYDTFIKPSDFNKELKEIDNLLNELKEIFKEDF